MTDDADLYLEPKRRLTWRWWLILGICGLLLLAAGGLALVLGAGYLFPEPTAEAVPTMTLVPTFTPRPRATETPPVISLSVRPWTDDSGPVGMVEVILSLPAGAQARGEVPPERVEGRSRTVSHEPPAGFRYWRGDLLQTRQGLAWSGASGAEVHWYLLREPDAALPATLEVRVDDQVLAVTLQPATPAMTSVPMK
jgi:hypothetical protein